MDPRNLKTFQAVVRHGSFSAAARELGYAQSAISQQISALEADVGIELLSRRPVAPTEAGVRLLEHAGAILLRLDAARADVARASVGPVGRLMLGATPLSAVACGRAIAAVRRTFATAVATVRIGTRDEIAIAVGTGELDAAIVDGLVAEGDSLELPATGLPIVEGAEEEIAIGVPERHPLLARRRPVDLGDLIDARWIDAPRVAEPLQALALLTRSGSDGFRPAVTYDGADVRGLLALVDAGEGLALLPRRVVARGVELGAPRLVHRTELLAAETTVAAVDRPGGQIHELRSLLASVFAEALAQPGRAASP